VKASTLNIFFQLRILGEQHLKFHIGVSSSIYKTLQNPFPLLAFVRIVWFIRLAPEASCRSAIDAARNVVADVGVKAAASSGGLSELAQIRDTNSERDCKRLLHQKLCLALPVQRSKLRTSKSNAPKIPILTMTNWIDFMVKNNCWHILCGLVRPDAPREEQILSRFWEMYKVQCPDHEIFQLAASGKVELSRTAPVVLHGDEGRGRKHRAHLVISFRSLLGRGIHTRKPQSANKVRKPFLKQMCNYKGHSYTNRFMIAGVRKEDYTGENAYVFDELMAMCASEAQAMALTGVECPFGKTHWLMTLHITGDWPWLHKSAGFSRSFNNALKQRHQSRQNGICHECLAGTPEYPFEQVGTRRPLWLTTAYQGADPFIHPSVFQIVPHVTNKFSSFWIWDMFHTWHLGVGKVWLGSALALLSLAETDNTIDDRFSSLTKRYKDWCLINRHRCHIQKISKECLNWISTRCYPCGTWHKGELTTVLMGFLEATLTDNQRTFPDDLKPLLEIVKQGTIAINKSIHSMYMAELWLTVDEGLEISGLGLRFLRRFDEAAHQARVQNMNLFSFLPKIHCLHKIYLRVHSAAVAGVRHLNPLAVSCQQCEDFIGRPSRLSRRVAGGSMACTRVCDRYLQACYSEWVAAGYLVRPL